MADNSNNISIFCKSYHQTIKYAAEELCKYLRVMADGKYNISFIKIEKKADITLGLYEDFNISNESTLDFKFDDSIYVKVQENKGIIAGSNPRSVLFAVYRFLEHNGCKWIRPGKDGEIVPVLNNFNLCGNIVENAYYRYRGNNNCGAYSLEHILEKIEWMPKVGLNTFFNEFFLPKMLFNHWYLHQYHSLKKPEPRSDAELIAFNQKILNEVKKRGLIYQTGGHGWPGIFFGLPIHQCDADKEAFDRKLHEKGGTEFLALIDEKRESYGPRMTELCYGNPIVRERMIQCIADYTEANPEIDILHFWLSDSMNTHCECDLCKNTRPSEFYVMILNGVDEELSKREELNNRKINTRIAFLIYQDLLWAPEREKIKNADRFIMMFAPGGRRYDENYPLENHKNQLPPFKYNKNLIKNDDTSEETEDNKSRLEIGGYIESLNEWRKVFKGDGFIFDYQMIGYHYQDIGYYRFAKTMAEDIRRTNYLGLKGFVSCQITRCSFPTSFPLHVHAKYLWNPNIDFEKYASNFFYICYGEYGELCRKHMEAMSGFFNIYDFNKPNIQKSGEINLTKEYEIMESFRLIIEKNLINNNSCQYLSWYYLFIYIELAKFLTYAIKERMQHNNITAELYWNKVVDYLMINENKLEIVFDIKWFFRAYWLMTRDEQIVWKGYGKV